MPLKEMRDELLAKANANFQRQPGAGLVQHRVAVHRQGKTHYRTVYVKPGGDDKLRPHAPPEAHAEMKALWAKIQSLSNEKAAEKDPAKKKELDAAVEKFRKLRERARKTQLTKAEMPLAFDVHIDAWLARYALQEVL